MKKNIPPKASAAQFPVYDFRTPKKVSKEKINSLNLITDELAKYLGNCMSAMAGEVCLVYNPEMHETNTTDFIKGQPKNTIIGNFAFTTNLSKHNESQVMLHMPTEIFYPIMDILLGGTGKPYEVNRSLTDIEIAICRYVMLKFQEALKDAWNSIIKVDFAFDKIETSSKNVELKAVKEEKLVMSFDVNIKDVKSKIRVAYSSRFVDKLIRKQETQKAAEAISAEQQEKKKEAIMTSLNDAEFEVKAVLSELTLNMQDIISLNVGDIITLDKKITDDIEVKVEDTPWFNGKLGNGNIKKAVKITKVLSGNTAENNDEEKK